MSSSLASHAKCSGLNFARLLNLLNVEYNFDKQGAYHETTDNSNVKKNSGVANMNYA